MPVSASASPTGSARPQTVKESADDEEDGQEALRRPGEEEDHRRRQREADHGEAPVRRAVGEHAGERRQHDAEEARDGDDGRDLDIGQPPRIEPYRKERHRHPAEDEVAGEEDPHAERIARRRGGGGRRDVHR